MKKEKTKSIITSAENNGISKSTKRPPKWFYLILVLIPIVFVFLLEIFLRMINYGNVIEQFVALSDYHPDKYY